MCWFPYKIRFAREKRFVLYHFIFKSHTSWLQHFQVGIRINYSLTACMLNILRRSIVLKFKYINGVALPNFCEQYPTKYCQLFHILFKFAFLPISVPDQLNSILFLKCGFFSSPETVIYVKDLPRYLTVYLDKLKM